MSDCYLFRSPIFFCNLMEPIKLNVYPCKVALGTPSERMKTPLFLYRCDEASSKLFCEINKRMQIGMLYFWFFFLAAKCFMNFNEITLLRFLLEISKISGFQT